MNNARSFPSFSTFRIRWSKPETLFVESQHWPRTVSRKGDTYVLAVIEVVLVPWLEVRVS